MLSRSSVLGGNVAGSNFRIISLDWRAFSSCFRAKFERNQRNVQLTLQVSAKYINKAHCLPGISTSFYYLHTWTVLSGFWDGIL